jgi:hypothetical protein
MLLAERFVHVMPSGEVHSGALAVAFVDPCAAQTATNNPLPNATIADVPANAPVTVVQVIPSVDRATVYGVSVWTATYTPFPYTTLVHLPVTAAVLTVTVPIADTIEVVVDGLIENTPGA